MKKNSYSTFTSEIEKVFDWHFQILGKDVSQEEKKLFFQVLVTNNPIFPNDEHIEVILKDFFSSIHYGSIELKGFSIRTHTIVLNEWLKNRTTIRPVSKKINNSAKPEDWVYDINEKLPEHIDRNKARELIGIIHSIYGSDTKRVIDSDNFMDYIDKLKQRIRE